MSVQIVVKTSLDNFRDMANLSAKIVMEVVNVTEYHLDCANKARMEEMEYVTTVLITNTGIIHKIGTIARIVDGVKNAMENRGVDVHKVLMGSMEDVRIA